MATSTFSNFAAIGFVSLLCLTSFGQVPKSVIPISVKADETDKPLVPHSKVEGGQRLSIVKVSFIEINSQLEETPVSNAFFWVPSHVEQNSAILQLYGEKDHGVNSGLPSAVIEKNEIGICPSATYLNSTEQSLLLYNSSSNGFSPQFSCLNNEWSAIISRGKVHIEMALNPSRIPGTLCDSLNRELGEVSLLIQPHSFGKVSDEFGNATIQLPLGVWVYRAWRAKDGFADFYRDSSGNMHKFDLKTVIDIGDSPRSLTVIWKETKEQK